MSERIPSERKSSSLYGESRGATIEVRRKKANLLDRKKALGGSASSRGTSDIAKKLSNTEMTARVDALRNASPRQELPPRQRFRESLVMSRNNVQGIDPQNFSKSQTDSSNEEQEHRVRTPSNSPQDESLDSEPQENGRREHSSTKNFNEPSSRVSERKEHFSRSSDYLRREDNRSEGYRRAYAPRSSSYQRRENEQREHFSRTGSSSPRRDDRREGGHQEYASRSNNYPRRDGDQQEYSSRSEYPRKEGERREYYQRDFSGEGGRSYRERENPNERPYRHSRYQNDHPTEGPVILRAASYGPRPQDKVTPPSLGKESLGKSEPKSRKFDRSRQSTPYANKSAETERSAPARRTQSDSDSQDRKTGRRGEGPKKLSRQLLTRVIDNDEETRVRSVASFKRAQKKRLVQKVEPAKVSRDVVIPDTITVGDLSNRMAVSSATVIKALMKLGTLASINQVIDGDTAELICVEFGHRPKRTSADDVEIGLKRRDDSSDNVQIRPPVITVMGHVDHGKTSLLDALRKTNVTASEDGGITQKIGAYQIITPYSAAKITFFDTPGHAAFSEMRARGADVTDIVVLVVAADDGVNEQTLEAISHAKASNAAIIVAINKIDKAQADPQKVRNELLNHNVILEDFGGDVMAVEISAKVGTNLDKLIEAILLQAEILELKASSVGLAEGVVVEASVERGRGIVATVLVQKGTLCLGDIFVAGSEFGRIKMMHDHHGNQVAKAGPSCPVEVLGFNGSPLAGDDFVVVESEQRAREVADHRKQIRREKEALARNKNSIEHMMTQIASGESKTLNIVIKADMQGSLEAIKSNVQKLSVSGVIVQVVHGAIGDVNETDVALAKMSNACIIGFGVKANPQARILADREGISIQYYSIIYEILENIGLMMKGQLAPTYEERVLGRADLRVVFSKGKVTKIAGCYVLSGLMRRSNSQVRVLRGEQVVFTGKIDTMKHEQDDIKESKEGHECGIILEGFNGIEKGDVLECFEIVEVRSDL
jgi:translation initiation factor IF-2